MRYRTLLEQQIDEWDDGYGVVQIVNSEGATETELQFAYYKNGDFVNRLLTSAPTPEAAARTEKVVGTMSSLVRTFTSDEIDALVAELGEEEILDLSVLIDDSARVDYSKFSKKKPAKKRFTVVIAAGCLIG